ncbi:MAG: hypothetical protein HRT94_02925 [Alphaproteobacteria bacterium]|nr:hypothetical protein [Alphaproteobacteria bacterium]
MHLPRNFGQTEVAQLFASEALIRQNRDAFRGYCYEIFQRRNLPLSHIALTFYLSIIDDHDKIMRKDAQTPREQHEESHIITMDALINTMGDDWIDPDIYGSIDALFASIVLHDVIEDFKISPKFIDFILREKVTNLYHADVITDDEYQQAQQDIFHTIEIVKLLSRKDEDGKQFAENDRASQAAQWLKHPYAFPIKQIDWCNKLQTMPNVEHFEKNDFARMDKVLTETAIFFVEQQQNMSGKAIKKYPQLKPVCEPLDSVMGMLFQTLRTYVALKKGSITLSPEKADPFNFDRYIEHTSDLLKNLPKGNNYISPLLDRIDADGEDDILAHNFLTHMIKPTFRNWQEVINIEVKIINSFKPQNRQPTN